MELFSNLIDIFLHIDKHLGSLISDYGLWIYLLLFLIIFCETGLVVTPFLPGDSLLFAAGAFAGLGSLNVGLLFLILFIAAVLGDGINYAVGNLFGKRILKEKKIPFVKKKYLDKTHEFYERYGAKTIVIARFVPIVRTFAPFVAGIGAMSYGRFLMFNIVGALIWISMFIFAGYFFGNLPIAKQNFGLIVLAIILISITPIVFELLKKKLIKQG
ncbi:MAG: DedA family protein [Actinobacteria bacterium]|nr:MAG: DedA family protein [Actinomycetota bacterium]